MKRNVTLVALAVALSLGMVGCAKTISGSVESVVSAAQEVSTDEKVNVEVTGEVAGPGSESPSGGWTLSLNSGRDFVYCSFDSKPNLTIGQRVTISGQLSTGTISDNSVFLRNCKVK